jgi:hypothetical protein
MDLVEMGVKMWIQFFLFSRGDTVRYPKNTNKLLVPQKARNFLTS